MIKLIYGNSENSIEINEDLIKKRKDFKCIVCGSKDIKALIKKKRKFEFACLDCFKKNRLEDYTIIKERLEAIIDTYNKNLESIKRDIDLINKLK